MRRSLWTLVFLPLIALTAWSVAPAQESPKGGISLMQTLSPWMFPGSKMPEGATMSDAGNPKEQAIWCPAIFSTPEPYARVVAFYADKLGKPEKGSNRSTAEQDDSKDRPVSVRVFVEMTDKTSTTVTVSRAQGESETHV
ncbi:MAG TPA: hypothetical protein VFT74_12970, partial [Isosphaeraceae bacterium]|nr:hypothetical protein [Isosphaeraceae bacterium]